MAVEVGWMQNQAYDAIEDRIVVEGLAIDVGVAKPTHFKVKPSSGLTVTVNPGTIYVRGGTIANQGMYVVRSTATESVTHGTAPTGGSSRIDLVIVEVLDGQVTGGGTDPSVNKAQVRIVPGTPGTSPSPPATPASSVVLAQVTLTSGLATIGVNNIANQRTLGGRGPHIGDARPAFNISLLKFGEILLAGQAISRTTFAELFELWGTTFGTGDGSTTFNVPDTRGRSLIGMDNLNGTSANRVLDATADNMGGGGGAATTVLGTQQMAPHSHPIDHNHAAFNSGTESADHVHGMTHNHAESGDTGGAGFAKRVPGSGSSDVYNVGTGVTVTYHANPGTSILSANTAGRSATHTHSVDVPAFAGASGNNSTTNSEVPTMSPYIATAWCVKAL